MPTILHYAGVSVYSPIGLKCAFFHIRYIGHPPPASRPEASKAQRFCVTDVPCQPHTFVLSMEESSSGNSHSSNVGTSLRASPARPPLMQARRVCARFTTSSCTASLTNTSLQRTTAFSINPQPVCPGSRSLANRAAMTIKELPRRHGPQGISRQLWTGSAQQS